MDKLLFLFVFNIFIVFNIFTVNILLATDCSITYIVPIFGDANECKAGDYLGKNCNGLIANILINCETKIVRDLITIFDFGYKTCFMCPTDQINHFCSDRYADDHDLILNRFQDYNITDQLNKTFNLYQECNKNLQSMVLFIVGTPCLQMHNYPEVEKLFLTNLNDTNEYFLNMNLRAIVVLLHQNKSPNDFCPDELTNLRFSENSYIETRIINYDSIYDIDKPVRDICSIKINYDEPQDHSPINEWPEAAVISIVCGVILGLIILFIVFWARQIWARYQQSKIEAFADEHARSTRHILFGKYKDEWEVTPKELKVDAGTVLGQGAFGTVYLGHLKKQRNKEWIEMDVAVKFVHENANEKMRQDMIEEIGFMKALGSHENLLVMVGYVKSIENPVICTIFCSNGDLLGILRKHDLHFMTKEKCNDVKICLLLSDLLRIAIEVCDGLCYLSSFNYIHRDIAARNVLLTSNLTAKLSDFGLCKKLEIHETTIIDKEGKFPVKYMPYESLKFGEFSEKTDVWSFGILIYEMFSGGNKPFDEIEISEFIQHLEKNGNPEMPKNTPQPIVQLLNEKIFQKYPSRRANFKEIKKELKSFYFVVSNVLLSRQKETAENKKVLKALEVLKHV